MKGNFQVDSGTGQLVKMHAWTMRNDSRLDGV